MKITHHDPELTMRRTFTIQGVPQEVDLTYYTDGRGETNPSTAAIRTTPESKPSGTPQTTSKTTWDKNKIITQSVGRFSAAVILECEIIDEWRLSSDGKTLTRHTTITPTKDLTASLKDTFVSHNPIDDFKTVYKLISK